MKEGFIAKEGYPLVACLGSVGLLAGLLGWTTFSIISFLLLFFVIFFFRNPRRNIPSEEDSIVSPADGKIMRIEPINSGIDFVGAAVSGRPSAGTESRHHGSYIKISIFMSLFDVHINRAPISGDIIKIKYSPGKFLSAYKDKASLENERNFIVLEGSKRIALAQVAGFIARRIVCYVKEGEFLKKGAKLGMIKFGSRADVFLPSDIRIVVKEGQRVKGGETILGYLP